MPYTDFLGNTIEEGDLIIYSPKGGTSGELVLAEVVRIEEQIKERYGYLEGVEPRKYGVTGTYINYRPTLQPISSTTSWRNTEYKRGEGRVPATPRKTFLQNLSSTMLYKKKEVTDA